MSNANNVLTRFLMTDGHNVEAILPPAESEKLVSAWLGGIKEGRVGGTDAKGRVWGLDWSKVIGLIAVPWDRFRQLAQEQLREQAQDQAMLQQWQQKAVDERIRRTAGQYPQY